MYMIIKMLPDRRNLIYLFHNEESDDEGCVLNGYLLMPHAYYLCQIEIFPIILVS